MRSRKDKYKESELKKFEILLIQFIKQFEIFCEEYLFNNLFLSLLFFDTLHFHYKTLSFNSKETRS